MQASVVLNSVKFVCPACQSRLQNGEGGLKCTSCEHTYPIVDGIPIFILQQHYYGEISQDRMRSLIEDSKRDGYKEAIRKYLDNEFVHTYVADEHRAKWMELLPLERHSTVLDVGCGWGTTAIPISRQVGTVVAMDATYERVKFVEVRAGQTHAQNVVPVVASALELPLASGQFDLVTFNGVLEWLGASDATINAKQCQMKALEEAFRVLKPGGLIYIGIENRFSLRYFLGDPDDHSFIRFTSLLPRWLADVYCMMRGGKPYNTYTHSLGVYQAMLTEAGFNGLKTYYPWPTYRNPEKIVPLARQEVLELTRDLRRAADPGRKWLYYLLLQAVTAIEGAGRACHSFSFVAQKP